MTATKNENIIFDSKDYIGEQDHYYILDDLDYLLSENIVEPRGEIRGWMFLSLRSSRYGSICNNGRTGFVRKDIPQLAKAILSVDTDEIVVEKVAGELVVNFIDHDGTHISRVKPIVKSRLAHLEKTDMSFDKTLAYIETMPSVRIKKTK